MAALAIPIALCPIVEALGTPIAPSRSGRPAFRGPVPIVFEENAGQMAAAARFVARQGDLTTWLSPTEIVFGLGERGQDAVTRRTAVRMKLAGANPSPEVVGLDPLPGESHYLIGTDPSGWRTHVRQYRRVAYRDVYPGIDLIFYSRAGRLEYDFDVQPGANEETIELAFDGMDEVGIDDGGDLVMGVPGGHLRHRRPASLESAEADHRPLETRFSRRANGRFGFHVEGRDRRRRVRIDPEVEWIRLPGADNDWGYDVAVDHEGNTYLTGMTSSADFPVEGGMPPSNVEKGEAFVLKLGPDLQIVYSTFLGATNTYDVGIGIAVDSQGQAVVSGATAGNIAEVSAAHPGMCAAESVDTAFLAMLAVDGASLRFSTCLPADAGQAVAVGPLGDITVVGWTVADAFIGRYLPSGQNVFRNTWGGSSRDRALDVAVDSKGHAFVVGRTDSTDLPGTSGGLLSTLPVGGGFVAEFTPTGGLARATYLGGSGGRSGANGVALDRVGDVYVTGWTFAPDFPLLGASRSTLRDSPWGPVSTAFVTKLRPNLAELVYSTFYAQPNVPVDGTVEYVSGEEGSKVAVDSAGNAYVVGLASTFHDTTYFEGVFAWVAGFDPAGQPASNVLLDLTSNGDEGYGIAVGPGGEVYVVGHVDYLWKCEWIDGVGQRCFTVSDSDVFVLRIPGTPPDGIVILSSTTRWKPQRDTAKDMAVEFTGPRDLKPAPDTRLRITAPSGNVLTSPTLAFAVVDGTSNPAKYRFVWSGPWTDADGNLLPAGDYKLNILGQSASGTPVTSQPADYVVSLVEVTAIRLEDAAGLSLQDNPGPGGGKRIFAEAAQPGGPISDKVKVIATIFPKVANASPDQPVRVFVRSFDVDDPSPSQPPVDDESWAADNCLQAHAAPQQACPVANDGLLYDPGTDPGAGAPVDGRTGIALQVSGDQAVAGLRVAMLQGANYRVAASTSHSWLAGLEAVQGVHAGELRHTTGESLTDPATGGMAQVSEMLTVWRTLFLQLAKMPASPDPQDAWEHQATAKCPEPPCIQGNWLQDASGMPHPNHQSLADAWMGADLDVTPATPRTDKHVVRNSTLTLLKAVTPLTPFDPAFNYALWDDEVASSTQWGEPDDSLARSILLDAFIEVEAVPPKNPPLFRRNLTNSNVAALPTPSPSSEAHWTAPVVLAFEGDAQGKDGDPSGEEYIFGFSIGLPGAHGRQPRTAIYTETIRDYSRTPPSTAPAQRVSLDEIQRNTTAHEILHWFGLVHDGNRSQGGIMCAKLYVDAGEANRTKVTPSQLKRLRQAIELKIDSANHNCP